MTKLLVTAALGALLMTAAGYGLAYLVGFHDGINATLDTVLVLDR